MCTTVLPSQGGPRGPSGRRERGRRRPAVGLDGPTRGPCRGAGGGAQAAGTAVALLWELGDLGNEGFQRIEYVFPNEGFQTLHII